MRRSTLYPGGSNITANQVSSPKGGSNNQSSGVKKGEREILINSDDEDADKKKKRKLQEAEQRVTQILSVADDAHQTGKILAVKKKSGNSDSQMEQTAKMTIKDTLAPDCGVTLLE